MIKIKFKLFGNNFKNNLINKKKNFLQYYLYNHQKLVSLKKF